jgi:hypothetical protein
VTFTFNVGEVEVPVAPSAGELELGGLGGELEDWGRGPGLNSLEKDFSRELELVTPEPGGAAAPTAPRLGFRFAALKKDSVRDLEARVAIGLTVGRFGLARLSRSMGLETGRRATDSSGIPGDTGARVGSEPITFFGAMEDALAPRSRA